MITVYLPTDTKQPDGKWYKEFEVPEGLPLGSNIVYQAPPENLLFPKYDITTGLWKEDSDSIIESLKDEMTKLKEEMDEIQSNQKDS